MLSLRRLTQSFQDARRGLAHVFRAEQNFRLQVMAAALVLAVVFYFPLRQWETVVILLLIVMVLTMEILNTALERFTDLLKPRLHHYVGAIKDMMAAAVLVTSLGALIIGTIIVGPYFISLAR
ncbi:MAG: diacylglycerol kinase [Candidatus Magasanikbacteria bacterium]|nr:diacylglycerol kinase [Candidatus Magasanikbacteria bacterium]